MQPLLDRRLEWERLEGAWARAAEGTPQLAVVWGRRRVGKTFLLSHFVEGKRAVFFGATRQAEGMELARLGEAVRRDLGERAAALSGGGFASWEAALRFLAALAEEEPLAVVLDEVPYLEGSTPGFASVVQVVWDHLGPGTRLLLVLTGSAVGAMETMLGAGGALRGRPTLSLRMEPLGPREAREFLPRLPAASFVEAYAACGGYPLHLKAWDPDLTTDENLVHLAGRGGGVLLEDAAGMLREELPEAPGYSRILAALGRGRTRFSEIASDAGQRIEHPLDVLIACGLVSRNVPIGAPRRSRPLYAIADTYLSFWFRVLYSDLPLIEGGQGEAVLRRVRPRWQVHLGLVFEELARAHAVLLRDSGVLPEEMVLGRWWATSGGACEIDVLGLLGSRTAFLGEARWQEAPLDVRDLRALEAKRDRVPRPRDDLRLALWGRSGATAEVRRAGALAFDVGEILDEVRTG